MTEQQPPLYDQIIIGGGPVGLALALALKDGGLDIAVVDARTRAAVASDPRDLALAHGSRLGLERLGVWSQLATTPIEHIHISQHRGFGRTLIEASEHHLPALGYVTPAGGLAAALRAAVDEAGITVLDETEASELEPGEGHISVRLRRRGAGGRLVHARLAACAEGGLASAQAGVVEHDYRQQAVIATVSARGGRPRTAYERFTSEGPIALLPKDERFALVHVAHPDSVGALLALDDAAYLARLQSYLGHRLQLQDIGPRRCFPLLLRYRKSVIGARTVWLGNAAQTMHPVAGQGFNLALRDVLTLADCLLKGRRAATAEGSTFDPGGARLLAAYGERRSTDRLATMRFTDSLIRIFSNDLPPLRHARGAALFALDLLPPLRKFIARRMMYGSRAWP